MAFIEHGSKRFTLPAGDMILGTGADCHLRLEGPGIALRHAVFSTAPDLSVSIRRLDANADVEVNGVKLGTLPQPLLHGDKVTIGGIDLLFVDERKSGSTQYISAVKLPDVPVAAPRPGAGKPTASTGGRVVSLTDGREYVLVGASLRFGRDAQCDVVVSGPQVSRRHCEIMVSTRGYVIVDSSTNGTFVNGERVQNQRLLGRGDIVRVGEEEFRFYADIAAAAEAPAAAPAAPQLVSTGYFPSPGAKPSSEVSPRTGEDVAVSPQHAPPPAAARQAPPAATPSAAAPPAAAPPAAAPPPVTQPPAAQAPAAPAPAAPQALAKFLVRTGQLKGQRLLVKVPIVNIGRADYNDLIIPDDSVSSQHAKLTRREGVWVLVDLGSTNGTMVDGEPVSGEVPLAPGAFVRFGDVQLVFEPTDDAAGVNAPKGTRMISAVKLQDLKPPAGQR
jgi:pSer/pThr/pTyr-binding forkhead associated (FHA) protein